MARDINHVTLIGRLVRDPEIKYTTSGTPVTKFSIANNNSYSQNNELIESVNYFDINVWGNQAINCEKYLKKGSQVAIIGSLRQNRWNDKTTGQTRSKVEITANSVQFLSPATHSGETKPSSFEPTTPTGSSSGSGMIEDPWNDDSKVDNSSYSEPIDNDDDIPF